MLLILVASLPSTLSGCDSAMTLAELEGSTVRVWIRSQTRHAPSEQQHEVVIGTVDAKNGTITLIEEGFSYPVPVASIVQVERKGKIVYTTTESP
ncbi:MAG: hypothetical protein AAF581_14035 [Planctomycetota bacterium]